MSKKKRAPKPDYGSLWRSYDKWQQEDRMWYEGKKAEYEKGADVGATKARMASSGLKEGSEAWKRGLAGVMAGRQDIDKAYADKQKDLQSSVVYQDLQKEYQKKHVDLKAYERKQFVKGAYNALGGGGDTGDFSGWKQAQADKQRYTDASGLGSNARLDLVFEEYYKFARGQQSKVDSQSLGFDPTVMSLKEWGAETYGSEQAENPYAEKGPTPEELAEMRAKQHASGRQKGAGIQQGIDAMTEESPWM